jgi:enoyl-CoA hydratase
MTDEITFKKDGWIATIILNRPHKLNAVTPAMAGDIATHVDRCNGDDAIRCVVITGAGDRAFCAGSDIRELDGYDTAWNFRNRADYCDAIRRLSKPAIAAVNGYAFGGGLETAMSCDIRIASENAQFAAPEIKLGWIGGGGMAALLTHSIGASNAAVMIMTGDPIFARQALDWGLVSEVVAQDALLARAYALAETIAARAPIAAETAKLNLRAAFGHSIEQSIQYERDLQAVCFATEDAAEGRAAFKEKRPPVFRRR